jgi:hypothetical protein
MKTFHGSYDQRDVTLLLEPIRVTADGVEPGAIQPAGATDFATQIASEEPMGQQYMDFFFSAVERTKARLAHDVAQVARALAARPGEEVVLVSLVRAGTPVGVLLQRALFMLGRNSKHYSISCTRKRGSDPNAMDTILQHHKQENLVFIDGWTGKGYIATELAEAMHSYNHTRGTSIDPTLVVLADLAGVSGIAASADDYLIPAAMLRSTVCGLISASMLNPKEGLADTVLFYEHLRAHDCSRYFVDVIADETSRALVALAGTPIVDWNDAQRREAKLVSDAFVDEVMAQYDITDRNKVKPGICEANRALLTRPNEMQLILRDPEADAEDVANLLYLAQRKGIKVSRNATLPYRAAVLLKA